MPGPWSAMTTAAHSLRRSILMSIVSLGGDYLGEPKIVDVNIRRLRLKIEDDPANPARLLSVRGYGYKWVD